MIERRYCYIKKWRDMAPTFGYDTYAVVYRTAVVLNAASRGLGPG